MAIILSDFEPSGDVVEVQFPGSKKRFKIPVSEDVITVDLLDQFRTGDYSGLFGLFPEDGQAAFKKLHISQVQQFVEAWTGSAKN